MGQVVELPRRGVVRDLLRPGAPLELPVRQRPLGDVQQRLLGEMADQARDWPRARAPRSARLLSMRRSCAAGSCAASTASARSGACFPAPAYGSQSSTDVLMYSTPRSWHHCRISPQSMFQARSIRRSPAERYSPSSAPMFSGVTRFLTNVTPCSIHGLQRGLVRIEVHDGDALRIDVDVPQQNRQRAPRDGAEADEQDSMRKCRHPCVPYGQLSFFTALWSCGRSARTSPAARAAGRRACLRRSRPWTGNR